ncbi:MAG: RdgB/HAM1 family non-canonical purine NTP pyrophosphatase [Cyanobium sp.]
MVIASGNAGKVREFARLLADWGLDISPMPPHLEVEETGATFAENARIKGVTVAVATGCWALADDSGLEVRALGGAPGVHSARYAPTDGARIERLLGELSAVEQNAGTGEGPPDRGARFVAALALADPQGRVVVEVEGVCEGTILREPLGEGGFGYDPVFWVEEAGQSFAQMDPAVKAQFSHRGRAFQALQPLLLHHWSR